MVESLPAHAARWPGDSSNSSEVVLTKSGTWGELRGKEVAERGRRPGGAHGALYVPGPLRTRVRGGVVGGGGWAVSLQMLLFSVTQRAGG